MEKFVKWIFGILGFVILFCMAAVIAKSSYHEFFGKTPTVTSVPTDSVSITASNQEPIVFYSVSQALETQSAFLDGVTAEDIYATMPPKCIETIVTTLLVKQSRCTVADIVAQYWPNRWKYISIVDVAANNPEDQKNNKIPDRVMFEKLTIVDSTKTPPVQ